MSSVGEPGVKISSTPSFFSSGNAMHYGGGRSRSQKPLMQTRGGAHEHVPPQPSLTSQLKELQVGVQTHWPSTHDSPSSQEFPQLPQCVTEVSVSTHLLPHLVYSALHLHLPLLHLAFLGQHLPSHLTLSPGQPPPSASATAGGASAAPSPSPRPTRRFSADRRETSPLASSRAMRSKRVPAEDTDPLCHTELRITTYARGFTRRSSLWTRSG